MIPTYSEYISRFVAHADFSKKGSGKRYRPGEHHFVAAYLVPKLYAIGKPVPDYINPDGTKGVFGDIVYFADGRFHFGIEAKLATIRLTSGEFNKWVVRDDQSAHPNVFIGVGTKGIVLCPWSEFREAYVAAVRTAGANRRWLPREIAGGYGPTKQVNLLRPHLSEGRWFAVAEDERESVNCEKTFTTSMKKLLLPLSSRAQRELSIIGT